MFFSPLCNLRCSARLHDEEATGGSGGAACVSWALAELRERRPLLSSSAFWRPMNSVGTRPMLTLVSLLP